MDGGVVRRSCAIKGFARLRVCFENHFHCRSRREKRLISKAFCVDQSLLTSAPTILKRALTAFLLVSCHFANLATQKDALEQSFAHPPDSARPWVNWFWLDGNISREGITADLEAMQRVGIGGVLLMDVTQDIPAGTVPFGGTEWRALFKHTVQEAARLGLQVSLHNAPGWCGSGGPWITPDLAMQKLVSS